MYDNVDDNVEEEDEKDDNGDVAEDEVEIDDVEDDEVKEEEDDVEIDDVEGEKDDDVEEEGRSIPRPGATLCASLHSRNALGHFTWATLCGNVQVKCRRPAGAPWSSTGLCSYHKNPSMWLGK